MKTIDADGAGSGTAVEEVYIYDGLREERGNAGDHILVAFDESDALTHRYLYGPEVDQVLASEEVTSTSAAGDVLWALTDHLGTVRDLVDYDAGADMASVVNHLEYDAFGNIIAESNAAVDFLYGFTGRERDEESSLQYNRARYYDAFIGQWLSEDPVGFAAGDENLVRYVNNNVLSRVDPSGLEFRHTSNNAALIEFFKTQEGKQALQRFDRLVDDLIATNTFAGFVAAVVRKGGRNVDVFWNVKADPRATIKHTVRHVQLDPRHVLLDEDNRLPYSREFCMNVQLDRSKVTDRQVNIIILGHELGHAMLRYSDPTDGDKRGSNVTICENPIRNALGIDMRMDYSANDDVEGVPFVMYWPGNGYNKEDNPISVNPSDVTSAVAFVKRHYNLVYGRPFPHGSLWDQQEIFDNLGMTDVFNRYLVENGDIGYELE